MSESRRTRTPATSKGLRSTIFLFPFFNGPYHGAATAMRTRHCFFVRSLFQRTRCCYCIMGSGWTRLLERFVCLPATNNLTNNHRGLLNALDNQHDTDKSYRSIVDYIVSSTQQMIRNAEALITNIQTTIAFQRLGPAVFAQGRLKKPPSMDIHGYPMQHSVYQGCIMIDLR